MIPVPHLLDVIHAVRGGPVLGSRELAAPWLGTGDECRWLSRSAWSLQVITALHQSPEIPGGPVFWVPDYFCNASLAGVRAVGCHLVFYPVTDDLLPDWDWCAKMAGENAPAVFVLVHYFGRSCDPVRAKEFCRKHHATLIEDCAHVLLPGEGLGTQGDFVLYSQHKHLALPDGALLVCRPGALKRLGLDARGLQAALDGIIAGLPAIRNPAWGWMLRRWGARVMPGFIQNLRASRRSLDFPCSSAEPGLPGGGGMTVLARRLLARDLPRLEAIACSKMEHWALQTGAPELPAAVPYRNRVVCPDAAAAMDLRRRAIDAGCPVATWPDLPPEVLARPSDHAPAISRLKQTVFFPVHHQFRGGEKVRRLSGSPTVPSRTKSARVRWDVPASEWDHVSAHAPKSSLLQSRAYAEAKREADGWVPRYGLIEIGGEDTAAVVVLEKNLPLGGCLARLNRGPAWARLGMETTAQLDALRACADPYHWLRGRVLVAAPNLSMDAPTLCGLAESGFRRRLIRPWHSLWLDLRPPEDDLRRGLSGKWRNQLVLAEKSGLVIEVSTQPEALDWMFSRHDELMVSRGFAGPSTAFLRVLGRSMEKHGTGLVVLRARVGGNPVAGVMLARHGTSGTYLIGWNGPDGRKLNANNFLLWQAMLALRQAGCTWFELGGLNDLGTPGIGAFKRGTGAEEYRLAGEYLSMGNR